VGWASARRRLRWGCRKQAVCRPVVSTDQGSYFTGKEWIGELTQLGIPISMDGKGRWVDNMFIEGLWRRVKHEDICLR
jgi:putative transposase